MTLSELIPRLQTILDEHGDIPFTCSIVDSVDPEAETPWGQDFVEIDVNDCGGGPYCDLTMETDRDYREEREAKNKSV